MRTWEANKQAINQLWPQCQWTDEERRLWHDDLSGLDQEVLYDAVRNVKRSHDTLYPQLKWMTQEYRELASAKRKALKTQMPREQKLDLRISDTEDASLATDFVAVIDESSPSDFGGIQTMVLDKLPKMHARTAIRLIAYARKRLLGCETQAGIVNATGDVNPLDFGGLK